MCKNCLQITCDICIPDMCLPLTPRLEPEGGDLLLVDCGVVGGDFSGESNALFSCSATSRLLKARAYRNV